MNPSHMVTLANDVATPAVLHFLATVFGSLSMYMFSLYKGFEGATPALKKLFPNRSQLFYDRLDFLIVVFAGSIIGWIFFDPGTSIQGLSAGFGWVGALSVLTNPQSSQRQAREGRK